MDCCAQGLVPRLKTAPLPRGEQGKTVAEARGNFLDGQHVYPGTCQFERQRDAIKPPADLDNCFRIVCLQLKCGLNSL